MCTFDSLEYPQETQPNFTFSDNDFISIAHICRCGTRHQDTPTVTCDCLVCPSFGLDLGLL